MELGIIRMRQSNIHNSGIFKKNETATQRILIEDVKDLIQSEVKNELEKHEERLFALKNKAAL